MSEKKTLVGIMTILFGMIGVDQFIMGHKDKGIKTILWFLLCLIPVAGGVFAIIKLIGSILRGVKVLQMSEADFEAYAKEGPEVLKFL